MPLTPYQSAILRELKAGSFLNSKRFRAGYWLGRRRVRSDTFDALWNHGLLTAHRIKSGELYPDGTKNESALSDIVYKAK